MEPVSFGQTGRQVSPVGLGGEGVLRTHGRMAEAVAVIEEAIARGITYFDSAPAYADSECYYGKVWGENPDIRKRIFQTSKSACRDREGALRDLEASLKRLQTDYLDLWQIHDVRTSAECDEIGAKGGALEAFIDAREQGIVHALGVTGHHDPDVLNEAVRRWPVDAVLLPVNPVEDLIGGFMTRTISEAGKKGLAVIGMKVLGGGHYVMPDFGLDIDFLLRFALLADMTLPIVGCKLPGEVVKLVQAAEDSHVLAESELQEKRAMITPYGRKLAFYRKKGGSD